MITSRSPGASHGRFPHARKRKLESLWYSKLRLPGSALLPPPSKCFLAVVFPAALLSFGFALVSAGVDWPETAALDSITPRELRSFVELLASEEMAGRRTGTPTNQLATLLLATEFKQLGLEPLPGADGYFQTYPLTRTELREGGRLLVTSGRDYYQTSCDPGEHFVPSLLSASGPAAGRPVLLNPTWVDHPEATPDLGGRLAVLVQDNSSGDRDGGAGNRLGRENTLAFLKRVEEQDGRGLILIHREAKSLESLFRRTWPEEPSQARISEVPAEDTPRIPFVHTTFSALAPCFDGVETNPDPAGEPIELPCEVEISVELERSEITARNVVACLPGGNPRLAHEYVLLSAHLDHLGQTRKQVFYGADDDASGVAAVLEIAEAFAGLPARPDRSLLFAFWNAEEEGLLGSRHFVEHPPVPLEHIAAVFQLDMVGRNQEVDDPQDPRYGGLPPQSSEENADVLYLVGYSRSPHLALLLQNATESTGLRLLQNLDNHPLQLLQRSDHWPFLERDIPAVLLTTGLHPDYHTPADRPEKIDYQKLARVAKLAFIGVQQAAQAADFSRQRPNRP